MHDHAAFLAEILAHPDDDLPRLVYADFLDETGRPDAADRAEFIRLQCELERCAADENRRAALRNREAALLRRHWEAWVAELVRADLGTSGYLFRRGFLHTVTLAAKQFASAAAALFRLAPTVRGVQLSAGVGAVRRLLETPELGNLAEFDLSRMCSCGQCPILAELRTLFASPLVHNLTHLTLAGDRIDRDTAAALVSSPHLGGLRSLDLSGNALGFQGTRVIAAAGFAHLRELNLSENGITPYGGRVIAAAPWLRGVRALDLSRNRLNDTSGRALLNAPFGDGLERLALQTNEFGREMKRLLKTRFGPKVQV